MERVCQQRILLVDWTRESARRLERRDRSLPECPENYAGNTSPDNLFKQEKVDKENYIYNARVFYALKSKVREKLTLFSRFAR